MNGQFSSQTIVSGQIEIIIEEVGKSEVRAIDNSLIQCASGAYIILTTNTIEGDKNSFFKFISYDPENKKAIFKVKE